ncbi:GGDEF domain-containing protein [Psychrobacillus sp.]|uniref:GGDEF domain-containing protein n=1 Tax=Psychrobacillus sp. TaxID=1871623 RepID=UPI0028BDB90D|nr:GGDEF domain-containing protein [Psychrobacillus sp.]
MNNLRLKLLLSLTIFALILVITVSYVNRQLLISDIQNQEENSRGLIENHILADMQTVDNAHYFFDSTISNEMEHYSRSLLEQYKKNPDVLSWDLEAMKDIHGMDIYILDAKNTIVHTTFEKDFGLNFSKCCEKFSTQLDDRRESGEFFTDGIDVSIKTGGIRKFSYLGTPDKKYMIELSVNLNNSQIFQTFNFIQTSNKLVEKYDDLLEVKTINIGGFFLNEEEEAEVSVTEMPKQFEEAFMSVMKTFKPVEYKTRLDNGHIETHRFLPYEAEQKRGSSTKRIIYVKYGNSTELALLKQNTKQFWLLLILAIFISFLALVIIIRILTKTVNLATYDSLTSVYNRATYINKMDELFQKRKNKRIGLILIDLDNFKQVNDQFGHADGDLVLVQVAKVLQNVIKKDGFVTRFGGDEFAIVVYNTDETVIRKLAEQVLIETRKLKEAESGFELWKVLSLSIGGAILHDSEEDETSLFKKADKALYRSKEEGKDQFNLWSEGEG